MAPLFCLSCSFCFQVSSHRIAERATLVARGTGASCPESRQLPVVFVPGAHHLARDSELTDVLGVVICQQKELAQNGLAGAVRNAGIQTGVRVLRQCLSRFCLLYQQDTCRRITLESQRTAREEQHGHNSSGHSRSEHS